MKARQRIVVKRDDQMIFDLTGVTDVTIYEGSLVINHDGRNGDAQTIVAPGCWSTVVCESEAHG